MLDCIFCRIVAGEAPADVVYQDDRFLAFLDHQPRTEGHCLVIPKAHERWVDDVPDFGDYFEVAKKVGKASKRALGSSWIQYLTIGELVGHAHIHVIPRFEDDRHGALVNLALIERFSDKKMREIAERIREEIED